MKKFYLVFAVLFVFVLFLSPCLRAEEEESYSCMVCHGDKKVEFQESNHFKKGIWCADCHGGNPESMEENISMSPKFGFVGKPDKKRVVSLCGNCHADKKRMKQYGIPTDQLENYQTSQHGIALLKNNDTKVAVCTDCHGTHSILPANDPASLVFPTKLPQTCANCHSDKELMDSYNLPSNVLTEYSQSVHGKALLEKNDRSAPTCARCHGNHGATPPGVTEVENVCGQCHIKSVEYFSKSPHQQASQEKLMSQCVSCHNNHYIEKPTAGLFDAACEKCHDKNSGAYKRGQQIKALLLDTQASLEEAQSLIEQAKHRGVDVEEDVALLEQASSDLIEAFPRLHALNVTDVEETTTRAKSISADVSLRIHEIFESFRLRKVGLGFIWLFIFVSLAIFYLKKRRADRLFDLQKSSEQKQS